MKKQSDIMASQSPHLQKQNRAKPHTAKQEKSEKYPWIAGDQKHFSELITGEPKDCPTTVETQSFNSSPMIAKRRTRSIKGLQGELTAPISNEMGKKISNTNVMGMVPIANNTATTSMHKVEEEKMESTIVNLKSESRNNSHELNETQQTPKRDNESDLDNGENVMQGEEEGFYDEDSYDDDDDDDYDGEGSGITGMCAEDDDTVEGGDIMGIIGESGEEDDSGIFSEDPSGIQNPEEKTRKAFSASPKKNYSPVTQK